MIGEPVLPNGIFDRVNSAVLLERIKQPDAFDVPIDFQEKDVLEIVINNLPFNNPERKDFYFEYTNGPNHS